jgi:hypothetical protein
VQDITKEAIDTIIKASETAVSQAVDFALKTDEINKRLIKSNVRQHIITCTVFALIMIFTAGFYFIGYTDYPKEETYVREDQGNFSKDILQTAKTEKIEECEIDGR